MTGLVVVVASVLNALLIGAVVRRLLAVPVGWPRTFILSLHVNALAAPVTRGVLSGLGSPDALQSTPVSGPATAVVILIIGWLLALEIMILAGLEAVVPTGSLPSPVQLLRGLPARSRRTRRYLQILRIAVRHGLGPYLRPRAAIPRGPGPEDSGDVLTPSERVARSLREALTDGGVTFVKLGQMLSTRPDLMGPAYIEELSRLHSTVPAAPWDEVQQVLQAELGRPLREVFADFDERPLAAASVAQIHPARLLDGRDVVVKVQRPSARREVTADLDIVLRLARRLDRTTGWGRRLGVLKLAHGFAASLEEELDYRVELANMRAVSAASSDLVIPKPDAGLSTRRLLVMDRLSGRPLSHAHESIAGLAGSRRAELADGLLAAVLRQLTVSGTFHADLHPGNIILTEDERIGLLDFGSVGRLDTSARESLARLLLVVDAQDTVAATGALLDLLDAPADLDERALERDVGQLVLRYGGGYGPGDTAQLVIELFRLVLEHGMSVPPPVAAAFRSIGALEGSLRLLDPDLQLVTASRRHATALVGEQLTPEALKQRAVSQLATALPSLQRIPRRLDRLTESLESGDFTVTVRSFRHEDDRTFVTAALQQLVVAMIAGALAIAGTVLVVSDHGIRLTPGLSLFTFFGYTLLLFGFVLGARSLVLVFRHHRDSRD